MELWIRSQNNGALTKVEMLGNTDGTIHSYLGINKTVLGEYKSNERALEVLDEIQKLIEDLQYMSYAIPNKEFSGYRPNVYEMPKE